MYFTVIGQSGKPDAYASLQLDGQNDIAGVCRMN